MLMMSVAATFAQTWEKGEEITGKIGNPSFTEETLDPWQFVHTGGSPTTTGGLVELYNGSEADLFQYIELPAGMYRLECQGYYRIGTSWDVDPKTYGTENWEDNALLYVQNGKYNIDSKEFTAGRTFKTPLTPRLFEKQYEQIYENEGTSWMSDGSYTVEGETRWGPCSIDGSLLWFAAGKYSAIDDGDNKYNTVTFFLTEDGYARIGVSKQKASSDDSFMATNFKLYYVGEAGEAAELMALQEEVDDLYAQLETLRDQNPGFLQGRLGDELMMYDMEYGSSADMDKDDCDAAKEKLYDLLQSATAAKNDLAALNIAIAAIEGLVKNTSYAGLDDLKNALDAAKLSISEEYVYEGDEDWDTYQILTSDLYKARLDYLTSSPKLEDGSWDFTAFINFPWFCNPEYEPSWDAETNAWVPNQDALDLGWSEKDDVDGTGADIASMVKLSSDQNTPGQWYQVNNGLVVYWNDNLTCVKKWDMPHDDDGVREVAQKIVDVPNGFYKLKALAQTWSNDWNNNCKNRIYIKSGENIAESPYLEPGGWWGKDINQWKELETGFVEVTNNELIIAGHDNGFAAVTGFRLFYYGETPDFNALIAPSLNEVKDAAAALAWAGDKAAAEAILAEIPASIEDNETFVAATATIAAANDYINKANAVVNNWKGIENFSTLGAKYDDSSVESSIIATALDATLELGEGENDTYDLAIVNNEQYDAYASYMDYRESIGEFITNATIAPIVEEQNAYLTGNFATVEKLDEFKLALGVKYNEAKFEADGINQATESDPKNVTFLLVNPSFDEGVEKGWTVEGTGIATRNEFSYDENGFQTNAELWNREPFTFSQVVSGLPAGAYEFRVRACYRDGGTSVSTTMVNNYNDAGGEEEWANHNAVLFAKKNGSENTSYIKAVESLKATENSFTQCGTEWEYDEINGVYYAIKISYMAGTIDESDQKENITYTSVNESAYPLDTKLTFTDPISLDEVTYYYPSSMQGFYAACKKDPTAYVNSVTFYLDEASNVELGIRKNAAISSDWIIMDDFELYYLGKEIPVAVEEITGNATKSVPVEYYNLSGTKQNGLQEGVNIVKYSDGQVKKVFIK